MIEIKGSVINDSIIAVKKRNGEQMYNIIVDQLDEQTKLLFNKTILIFNWYPLDSFTNFLESDIRLTANNDESELEKRSESLFEKQLKGIYKIFIKLGSPEFVLKRISSVHQSYFKGVSINITMDGSNKAIIKYIGFEKQHKIIEQSIIGFYKKALEISGAKHIQTKYLTSIKEDKGYCILEITWFGK